MLGEKKILKIALLGPPVVTFEDQVQTIKRKQTRSVLYFLACQKEPVSRGYLISKFWPNLSEQEGRKTLREILSNLRSCFNDVQVIVTRYDQLSLDPSITEVDVLRFQNLIDRVHFNLYTMPSGKLPDSLYRDLREGISLWRTPLFMDGFLQQLPEVETWITDTGNVLQSWRQALVERLVDHNISSGNLEEAIYWLNDALKIEPLKTDLHYLVLTCLRDCGKIEQIFRYRETLERIYTFTHGMEVPQVLLDFISRIAESQKQFSVHPADNNQNELSAYPPLFIGRKEILQQLITWSLGGGITVLSGESGVGKTRTMQEFHNRIDFPFRSIYCVARPMEQNLPLRPFIEGLTQAIKREEWSQLDPKYAEALLSIMPDLPIPQREEELPGLVDMKDQNPVIFEAVLDLLNMISKHKRLILFFDNAQWADDTSLNLLAFLTNRGVFQKKGFLLLSHRIEERNLLLLQYITHVQARQDFHKVVLDYLSDSEIQELAYSLLGKVPPAAMIERLKTDVGGNPLFLIQTLKLVMDFSTNVDALSRLQSFPVAREAISSMRERLESMDQNTRRVLDSAAVIGESFTTELLEDVSRLDSGELARVTDDLVNLHVIRVDSNVGPAGGYVFSHRKMHEALLASLNPTRRRMLYKQVIEALHKRNGNMPSLASTYAVYFELAGEIKEAFSHWLQAALYACEKSDTENVSHAFQKAMTLLEASEDQFSDDEVYQLISSWGGYAFDQNDLDTCEMLFNRCLELGEKRFSRLLQGTAHSGIARLMGLRRQMTTASKHMQQSLDDLSEIEPGLEMINAYVIQGYLSHEVHDFITARKYYQKAIDLLAENKSLPVLSAQATAQAMLSVIYSQMGDLKKGDEMADRSIECIRHIRCGSARIHGYIAKCLAQFYMANYREVIDLSRHVMRHLDVFATTNWATLFYSVLSGSYMYMGQIDKAWEAKEKAQSLVHAFTPIGLDSLVHELQGDFYVLLERFDDAEKEYVKAVEHHDHSFFDLESLYKLGYVKCRKGESGSGIQLFEDAFQIGSLQGLGMITFPAKAGLLVFSHRGDVEGSWAALDAMTSEAQKSGLRFLPLFIRLIQMSRNDSGSDRTNSGEVIQNLSKEAYAISNIWLELRTHTQICESQDALPEARQHSRTRINAILDTLAENSLSDPVRDMVREYIEGLERKLAT